MLCTGRCQGDASGTEFPAFLIDAYLSSALQDVINLVRSFVGVSGLFLAWFETIDIAEHTSGVKEIDLLHLLSSKSDLRKHVFEAFHRFLTMAADIPPGADFLR